MVMAKDKKGYVVQIYTLYENKDTRYKYTRYKNTRHKRYVAEKDIQTITLLHSKEFLSETDIYVCCDNQYVRIALLSIPISTSNI